jgi:hypothetical protein
VIGLEPKKRLTKLGAASEKCETVAGNVLG